MSEQNESPAAAVTPAAEPALTDKGQKRRTLIKGAVAAAGSGGVGGAAEGAGGSSAVLDDI